MGVPHTTLCGPIPDPRTLAFFDYFEHPVVGYFSRRESNCPRHKSNWTVYFYARTARAGGRTPHDTNNTGLDNLGLNLSAAVYTAASREITLTAAFTSYVWEPDDYVYCTAGIVGLYKIASKKDNNTIVLLATGSPTVEGHLPAPTSDATGVASSTGPFLTISKLNSLLGAGGSQHHRLRCNDEWNEGEFTLTGNNFCIDSFGIGRRPNLTGFVTLSQGGWTQDETSWTRTVSNVMWIREQAYPTSRIYTQIANQANAAANTAKVKATPYSFNVNGTTVRINPGTGYNAGNTKYDSAVNPNSDWFNLIFLQYCTVRTAHGYTFSGDQIRLHGLAFEGWGMNQSGTASYGVRFECSLYEEIVATGCRFGPYMGYHPFGTTGQSSNGQGIVTLIDCIGGGACPSSLGESQFNWFMPGAGAELAAIRVWCPWGSLPSDYWLTDDVMVNNNSSRGNAHEGHTSVDGARHGLLVLWQCKIGTEPWGPAANFFGGGAPTAASVTDVKHFVVEPEILGFPLMHGINLAPDNCIVINPKYEVMTARRSNLSLGLGSGYIFNGDIIIDARHQNNAQSIRGAPTPLGFFQNGSRPEIYRTKLHMRNNGHRGTVYDPGQSAANIVIYDSMLIFEGNSFTDSGSGDITNVTNSATYLKGLAVSGLESGFNAAQNLVILGGAEQWANGLVNQATGASGLQYDHNRRPLRTNTIGPYEPAAPKSGSVQTSGGVFLGPEF